MLILVNRVAKVQTINGSYEGYWRLRRYTIKNSIVFWISSNGGTIDKASNDKAEYYVTVKVLYYYD